MGGAHPIFIHGWISILLDPCAILCQDVSAQTFDGDDSLNCLSACNGIWCVKNQAFPAQPSQKPVNSEALELK